MNRRSFFKFLGIGAATAAVAPKMLANINPSSATAFEVMAIDESLKDSPFIRLTPKLVKMIDDTKKRYIQSGGDYEKMRCIITPYSVRVWEKGREND
jgi:hypothetical protein